MSSLKNCDEFVFESKTTNQAYVQKSGTIENPFPAPLPSIFPKIKPFPVNLLRIVEPIPTKALQRALKPLNVINLTAM